MQLLIDSVRYQRDHAKLNTNRIVIRKIKNDGEALKEASEQIRSLISECIERNLPIDDALAALHVATIKGGTLNKEQYESIIQTARAPSTSNIKQSRSDANMSLLKKIEARFKDKG